MVARLRETSSARGRHDQPWGTRHAESSGHFPILLKNRLSAAFGSETTRSHMALR